MAIEAWHGAGPIKLIPYRTLFDHYVLDAAEKREKPILRWDKKTMALRSCRPRARHRKQVRF